MKVELYVFSLLLSLAIRLPSVSSLIGIRPNPLHRTRRESRLSAQVSPQGADLGHQIFCNVELNAGNLEAVGFDMDFTLAQYNEAFDLLAFEGAKERLVKYLGYPKEVLDFKYR
jgi:5' nucleotidase family